MTQREYAKMTVTPKAEAALRAGHPWVYGAEITQAEDCADGALADVYSRKGRYLGTGYFNSASKIRVRVISRNPNDRFDAAFYRRRLQYAVDYRRTVMGPDFSCCRLIFGEADQFPGLTVDRFGDVLAAQVMCLGTDNIKTMLLTTLVDILREAGETISAVYERSEGALRAKEGLSDSVGFLDVPGLRTDLSGRTVITENGILYNVDYISGQKTGFFLDQKYNRAAAARLAPGRTVLDCFTHTGAFALNAAKAGAAHVCAVDVSPEAIACARSNAALNGLEGNMSFQTADVFDLLESLEPRGKSPYDYIILDPPAFTKSTATVKNAIRGYKEINCRAMKLLPRGGYLATCSCSHFMTNALFQDMLRSAAFDADVSLRQIEQRQQAPDHPILWNVPETDYLKFYLFQIV